MGHGRPVPRDPLSLCFGRGRQGRGGINTSGGRLRHTPLPPPSTPVCSFGRFFSLESPLPWGGRRGESLVDPSHLIPCLPSWTSSVEPWRVVEECSGHEDAVPLKPPCKDCKHRAASFGAAVVRAGHWKAVDDEVRESRGCVDLPSKSGDGCARVEGRILLVP